ncbi:MAG: endo-1,4-beta-xylanase [Gemmataceae bacterium]|nr:endo-1,4-beta-xylanase [Gemmataceae bacterium]MCI0741255.1 endo-1,4-beta-xylanase [Gemmataceae bacterium]
MGTMILQLPRDMPALAREELERASVAGGQDYMPYHTQAIVDDNQLILHRSVDESGCVVAPWNVNGAGRLMVGSATLMERLAPYQLAVELARGKINQLRGQTSDWLMGGLLLPDDLAALIQGSTHSFSRAVTQAPTPQAEEEAQRALALGFQASEKLVGTYMNQVFQVRHLRQPHLDTLLTCRLTPAALGDELDAAFADTFNAVTLPFSWADIEPEEGSYRWDEWDELVNWALRNNLPIQGGPLVDFSGRGLPCWLWEKQADLVSLCGRLTEFVSQTVERYREQIKTWQVTAASNWAGVLALADEELLWLTVRLAEAVKQSNADLELIIGVAQPWGDYLAHQERKQSPFLFADTLVRTGLRLAAINLEVLMAVSPRGSYCRDILDLSRLLDLYAILGMPLQVTLGYPSSSLADQLADPDQKLDAGQWRDGFTPEVQGEWATQFAGLSICKPYVRAVEWVSFRDAHPHQFPHCGLVDGAGKVKPALRFLSHLRAEHLK